MAQSTPLSLAKSERQLIRVSFEGGGEIRGFLTFVTEYGRQRFAPSAAERIALASNELLENAARFGSLASEISYALELNLDSLEVVVTNTTVGPRVEMLSEHLRRLDRDAEAVYSSELGRSLANGGRRSMLGLARIRYEGGMTLSLGVSGNQVTVRARCAR